jgi:hypothetical protein
LCDLEQCAADLITVADANVIRQSFDREILAELPMAEVGPLQLLLHPQKSHRGNTAETTSQFALEQGAVGAAQDRCPSPLLGTIGAE